MSLARHLNDHAIIIAVCFQIESSGFSDCCSTRRTNVRTAKNRSEIGREFYLPVLKFKRVVFLDGNLENERLGSLNVSVKNVRHEERHDIRSCLPDLTRAHEANSILEILNNNNNNNNISNITCSDKICVQRMI